MSPSRTDSATRNASPTAPPAAERTALRHPKDLLLREDRLPHIWCPTCGIGTCVASFIEAIAETGIPEEKFAVISGIGCTGRVAGYVKLDSFHTTHGRAIPYATGLHLAHPEMKVVVFSGDGDLVAIGGNHLIHAARRNLDITIICVNNFIYGMTGGQLAPTTPHTARTTTSPKGNWEYPFNVPHLVASCGATYVARWTSLHVRRMRQAMREAILKRGFSLVEIIAPCSTLYARKNRLGTGYDLMKFYHDNCEVRHGADTKELDIEFQQKIAVGKFVDVEKPTFLDRIGAGRKK
ncbi:MAG: 2-oxoacid:ferredoxin oxidoreductase subunit beta [Candidatus Eisenbacteria bacterium]|nr:2-oxoacid:ferredoxin oxidoreductase subunit beta [Candidatus Eisenbacteria bacterium]